MNRCDRLAKTLQRRCYDFLLTRHGVALLFLGALALLVCLLQLSDTFLEYRTEQFRALRRFGLSLAANVTLPLYLKKSGTLARPPPPPPLSAIVDDDEQFEADESGANLRTDIDVVYTWVNGSDPAHLAEL